MIFWLNILFFTLSALAAKNGNINYADLVQIISKNNVKSIDQLLPLLPLEYRKSYTFVYNSKSSQKDNVTPDFPRAIVFGDDASFVLTFTKKPETGEDTLETMEWDKEKEEFKFRELVFDGKKNPLIPAPEVNPTRCLECHGNPPRPNWDAYNIWPGVYGSLSREDCETMKHGSPEEAMYKSFLKKGRSSARYKQLPQEITKSKCDEVAKTGYTHYKNGKNSHPNAELSSHFNKYNLKRMIKIAKASPLFEKFKYLIVGLKYCDPDLNLEDSKMESFFPANYKMKVPSFKEVRSEIQAQGKRESTELNKEFEVNNQGAISLDEILKKYEEYENKRPKGIFKDAEVEKIIDFDGRRVVGRLDYRMNESKEDSSYTLGKLKMIFDSLDIRWSRLSTGFENGTYNFTDPDINLEEDLFEGLVNEGPFKQTSCEQLARLSREALSSDPNLCGTEILSKDQSETISLGTEVGEKLIIQSTMQKLKICLDCHDSKTATGKLSLDLQSEESFSKQLKQDPMLIQRIRDYIRGFTDENKKVSQMPMGETAFDLEEQKVILQGMEKLKAK